MAAAAAFIQQQIDRGRYRLAFSKFRQRCYEWKNYQCVPTWQSSFHTAFLPCVVYLKIFQEGRVHWDAWLLVG